MREREKRVFGREREKRVFVREKEKIDFVKEREKMVFVREDHTTAHHESCLTYSHMNHVSHNHT